MLKKTESIGSYSREGQLTNTEKKNRTASQILPSHKPFLEKARKDNSNPEDQSYQHEQNIQKQKQNESMLILPEQLHSFDIRQKDGCEEPSMPSEISKSEALRVSSDLKLIILPKEIVSKHNDDSFSNINNTQNISNTSQNKMPKISSAFTSLIPPREDTSLHSLLQQPTSKIADISFNLINISKTLKTQQQDSRACLELEPVIQEGSSRQSKRISTSFHQIKSIAHKQNVISEHLPGNLTISSIHQQQKKEKTVSQQQSNFLHEFLSGISVFGSQPKEVKTILLKGSNQNIQNDKFGQKVCDEQKLNYMRFRINLNFHCFKGI